MKKTNYNNKTKKEKKIFLLFGTLGSILLLSDTIYLFIKEGWQQGLISVVNEFFFIFCILFLFFYIKKRGWRNFNLYWKSFVFILFIFSIGGYWLTYGIASLVIKDENKITIMLGNAISQTILLIVIYFFFLWTVNNFKKNQNI